MDLSIHSANTGRDFHRFPSGDSSFVFQSTLPIQAETSGSPNAFASSFLSIHSANTGRDFVDYSINTPELIFQSTLPIQAETKDTVGNVADGVVFQSTLPIQAETVFEKQIKVDVFFQSTLPIQAETGYDIDPQTGQGLSIHSANTGRDFQPS